MLIAAVVMPAAGQAPEPAWSAPAAVVYFDMAIDEARQLIYASDRNGGNIDVISLASLGVVSSVSVGSQPTGLDIDPDDDELAVALYGEGEIAFVDLEALTVITGVAPAGTFGPNQPYDVQYGRPGRLYSVGNPGSGGFDYVHVFDTDTHTELNRSTEIMRAAPRLAMTADQNTLYVSEVTFSPEKIYRFDISTDLPSQTAQAPHGPVIVNTMCVGPGGKVFASSGQVWSADLTTLLTTLPAGGNEIECSDLLERVYITTWTGTGMAAFDANTYAGMGGFNPGGSAGVARLNEAQTTLYVSTSGGVQTIGADHRPRAYLPLAVNACQPVYSDTFDNAGSGWPVANTNTVRYEYNGGEYRIQVKSANALGGAAPGYSAADFIASVSVRNASGVNGSYGLLFGLDNGWTQLYTFEITRTGDYAVWRYSSNAWTLLTSGSSPAILTGAATNRLKIEREGTAIRAYANGQLLANISDGALTGVRRVGLINTSFNQGNVDARYDDFAVYPATCDAADVSAAGDAGGKAELDKFAELPDR